jgi:hypothetical protein
MVLGFGFLIIYSLQVLLPPQQDVFVVLEIAAGAIYLIFIVDLLLRLIAAGKNLLTVGGLLTFLK